MMALNAETKNTMMMALNAETENATMKVKLRSDDVSEHRN